MGRYVRKCEEDPKKVLDFILERGSKYITCKKLNSYMDMPEGRIRYSVKKLSQVGVLERRSRVTWELVNPERISLLDSL